METKEFKVESQERFDFISQSIDRRRMIESKTKETLIIDNKPFEPLTQHQLINLKLLENIEELILQELIKDKKEENTELKRITDDIRKILIREENKIQG